MQLLSVLPLTHVPRLEPQVYTYFTLAEGLPRGSVVLVPLGQREVEAVVVNREPISPAKKLELKRTTFQLRPISRAIVNQPVIDQPTLELLSRAAAKFAGALSLYAKVALPPKLFKKLKNIPDLEWPSIDKAEPLGHNSTFSGADRITKVINLVKKTISKNQKAQVLIVVSWRERLNVWQAAFNKTGLEVSAFDARAGARKRWHLMAELTSGRCQVLLGARSAIFLPLPRLALVVIDEAQSDGHLAFDQQPYYDARILSELKAKIQGADFILAAPFPPLLAQTTHTHTPFKAKFEAVRPPLAPEIFSPAASTAIASALQRRQKVLLYLNRRGVAPLRVCRRCGYVPRCPKCALPFAYHMVPSPTLLCHSCGQKIAAFELCPQCRRDYLKPIGIGTQALEKTVKARWPAVPCFRLDADTAPNARTKADILANFNQTPGAAVILGTAAIFSVNQPVALAVAPQIDLDLYFPSYRSTEETFLTIGKLYDLTSEQLIVQTLTPEAGIFTLAKAQNIDLFLKRERQVRLALGFPPAVEIAKITLSGPDFAKTLNSAREQRAKLTTLKAFFERQKPGVTADLDIVGPLQGFHGKKPGSFEFSLILKIPPSTAVIRDQLLEIIHPRARLKIDPPDLLA